MLAQLSGGDGDTVIRAAGELLGVQFSDIELQDVYPAKVALYVDQSLLSEERLALIDQIAVALKRILTAGVGLRLYLRTYRTYRYDLNIGHGAMVNVVRWLPPVSQDRSSRADFKSATAALPKLISIRRLLEKTGCLKAALKHQEEPICRL